MNRDYAEDRLQAAIVAYLRTVMVEGIVFSIPNGGLRSKAIAAKMKWTGALAGVSDLVVVAPSVIGFIEVKTDKGVLSKPQKWFRDFVLSNGFHWCVLRSIEDARSMLTNWGIQTREAVE